jgi:hypothetical protein
MGEIFTIYTPNKGLITRIYRAHKKLNEPMKKWAEELNRAFSKEEAQVAKKCMQKCSHPWPHSKFK